MQGFLEKIKKLDKRIIIGTGIGVVLVILVVLFFILGGKTGANPNEDSGNPLFSSESEVVDNFYQTEEEEVLESTEGTEIQNDDSLETEDTEISIGGENASGTQKQEGDATSDTKPEVSTKPSQPEQIPSNSEENTNKDEPQSPSGTESAPVVTESYTVSVTSAGGHNLYNVKVHAYTDNAMSNLFTTAATNSKGIATLQLEVGKNYTIALTNVPEGYKLNTSYTLTGKATSIVLESSIVIGKDYPSKKLKVGSVMYDFTVPSADGGQIKLSEVIKTKELVVLNFWYVNCQFCVMEFPYMSSAYNRYKDKVEIIALDPFDDMDAVKTFLEENPLPFKVATCDTTIPNLFGVEAYPVSVVIDKHGVIRQIEKGAILQESGFISLFNKYL